MKTWMKWFASLSLIVGSPVSALSMKSNLGAYVGLGLERINSGFTDRFTVSSDATYTDMAFHDGSFGTLFQGGYVFGGEELNTALELNYHIPQNKGAQIRFVPSASIQSFGQSLSNHWDVSFKPSVRLSRGTSGFVRFGMAQTRHQLFYRDSNLNTYRTSYQNKGWLWGLGLISRLTDHWAVSVEYQNITPRAVTFDASDPFISTISAPLSSVTQSADGLSVRHKIHSFSLGFSYFLG